jgi:hypothetical protein
MKRHFVGRREKFAMVMSLPSISAKVAQEIVVLLEDGHLDTCACK